MRLLLAALVAAGLLVLSPVRAVACSCAAVPLREQVEHSDSIGVGEVAWIAETGGSTTIAVDFTRVYKGSLGAREKVTSPGAGDSCAVDVAEGRTYAFFLSGRHRGNLRTALCSGTGAYDAAQLARLQRVTGAPHRPVAVDRTTITPRKEWLPTWLLVGLGGAGAAGLAVLVLSRGGRER